jgi:hypothetical protein
MMNGCAEVKSSLKPSMDVGTDRLGARIADLYAEVDPGEIIPSGPSVGPILAASILRAMGDSNRFANPRALRSFTGRVPGLDQSGDAKHHTGPTRASDPRLCEALYLAAEHARLVDPTLAAKYYRRVTERDKTTSQRSATSPPHSADASQPAGATASVTSSGTPTGASSARPRDAPWSPSIGRSPKTSDARTVGSAKVSATSNEHGTDQRSQKSTNAAPDTGPPAARHDTRIPEKTA